MKTIRETVAMNRLNLMRVRARGMQPTAQAAQADQRHDEWAAHVTQQNAILLNQLDALHDIAEAIKERAK